MCSSDLIDETRHYQPDPLLAPYVEQTFQKYADGATMTDLRDWLKAHNIKNSMGGEMSYNTIQRMLSNRRCCCNCAFCTTHWPLPA